MRKFITSLCSALLLIALASSAFAQGYMAVPRDPCDTPQYPQASVLISQAATTAQLVAAPSAPALFGGGTAQIYVCGYSFASNGNFSFVNGTGTNCGTGQASLTGTMITQVSPIPNQAPAMEGSVLVVPAGNALCLTSAGSSNVGWLWYAIQ